MRAVDPSAVEWFESIRGRVVVLSEPDGVYRRWFTEHATSAALQRPDFHLYGCATDAAAATALLGDLRRDLTTYPALQGAAI